ncbi:hypothetical protein [Mesorhizobium sp. KR9-304]|uniref:hypothetical protein n=1 Tax=Mesorhizobium sp. KR9-304 TaxID=3156614 RepID=UPI0032B3191D
MNSVSLSDAHRGAAALRAFVTPWRMAWLLAALAGALVSFWPLGMAGDYMNHLARNHIEARLWFDPILHENYTVSFEIIPDLAMDMIVPWLSYATGIYAAGAFMIWAAFVLPPIAGLLIARTLHGRVSWVALLGFLAMFNQNMQWGFVNFAVSTGLALIGFALWIRSGPSWRRTFAFAPFGVLLALGHALGFLLLGYLVLLWEIASYAAGQRGSPADFLRQLATKDAAAMVPGLLVVLIATGGAEQLPQAGVINFALGQKIDSLWSGAAFFSPSLAKLVTIVLVCVFWLGLRRGVLAMEPRMVWVCGGLLALIVALPTTVLGIWGLQFRYQAVLIILAAASVRVAPGHDRLARQVAVAATLLLAAVYANGAFQMARIDGFARANRDLLAGVSEGARVLSAGHEEADPLLAFHAAAIAVIERSAYVPNLFTNTSPVGVRPEMRAFHMPQAWPLLEAQLAASASLEPPGSANGYWSPEYYYGWPRHWDYVVYFRSTPEQSLSHPFLCRQAEVPGAVLYRISRDGCAPDAAQVSRRGTPSDPARHS